MLHQTVSFLNNVIYFLYNNSEIKIYRVINLNEYRGYNKIS